MQIAVGTVENAELKPIEPGIIRLSQSVFEKERLLAEQLRHSMDEYIVAQNEAKEALVSVLISGMFNVFREQGVLGSVFL